MYSDKVPHIPSLPFTVIRMDYLLICDRDHCAAKILSLFEAWSSHKDTAIEQAKYHNAAALKEGLDETYDETGWMYNSVPNLQRRLLFEHGEKVVSKSLKLLKDKGFILTRQNPKYRWDRTTQYLFQVEAVTHALRQITPESLLGFFTAKDPIKPETLSFLQAFSPEVRDGTNGENNDADLDTAEVRHGENDGADLDTAEVRDGENDGENARNPCIADTAKMRHRSPQKCGIDPVEVRHQSSQSAASITPKCGINHAEVRRDPKSLPQRVSKKSSNFFNPDAHERGKKITEGEQTKRVIPVIPDPFEDEQEKEITQDQEKAATETSLMSGRDSSKVVAGNKTPHEDKSSGRGGRNLDYQTCVVEVVEKSTEGEEVEIARGVRVTAEGKVKKRDPMFEKKPWRPNGKIMPEFQQYVATLMPDDQPMRQLTMARNHIIKEERTLDGLEKLEGYWEDWQSTPRDEWRNEEGEIFPWFVSLIVCDFQNSKQGMTVESAVILTMKELNKRSTAKELWEKFKNRVANESARLKELEAQGVKDFVAPVWMRSQTTSIEDLKAAAIYLTQASEKSGFPVTGLTSSHSQLSASSPQSQLTSDSVNPQTKTETVLAPSRQEEVEEEVEVDESEIGDVRSELAKEEDALLTQPVTGEQVENLRKLNALIAEKLGKRRGGSTPTPTKTPTTPTPAQTVPITGLSKLQEKLEKMNGWLETGDELLIKNALEWAEQRKDAVELEYDPMGNAIAIVEKVSFEKKLEQMNAYIEVGDPVKMNQAVQWAQTRDDVMFRHDDDGKIIGVFKPDW